jgi:HEAT repeat protein
VNARDRRTAVIVAGHRGDVATVLEHVADRDAAVRAAALTALERAGSLTDDLVIEAFDDAESAVRRTAAELAGKRPGIDLRPLLHDDDPTVVEIAAWACGEQVTVGDAVLTSLISLATDSDDPLVREAAAASLGAIGDPRGLPAVLAACADKPHVRRRAVLALAPFDGDEVEAAIDRALADRDWQVRQAAEDLRRAAGQIDVAVDVAVEVVVDVADVAEDVIER